MSAAKADINLTSKVALQSLRTVIFFALLAIALMFVERLYFQHTIASSWDDVQKISKARTAILLADEQMTMSAIAVGVSGDLAWKKRYDEALPKFQAAVNDAKALTSPQLAKTFDQQVAESHTVMAELEQLVFDLVENGEQADAANVFTSPRYVENKKILSTAINSLLENADKSAHDALESAMLRALIFVVSTLMVFFLLSGRLRRALGKSEASFSAAQDEHLRNLAILHEKNLKTSRMEQLGNITSTMAHELRNPLSSIYTSSFMLSRLWPNRDERVDRAFERISTGIARCDKLITQLLDYSSLGNADKREVEFDSWLEKALGEMAKTLNASIELSCVLGAPNVKVDIDATQMQKAVNQLLINASEAMISRDGSLATTNQASPIVNISTQAFEDGVLLVLNDNGPGIPPQNLRRLMQPFFTTKNFGVGLGLPTVQHIVEQHRGKLEIATVEGTGATVKITLPAA